MFSDYPEIFDLLSSLSEKQIQDFKNGHLEKIKTKNHVQSTFIDEILKQIKLKITPNDKSQHQLKEAIYGNEPESGETFRYLLRDIRKKLFNYLDEYYSFSENSERTECQNKIHTAFYLIELNQANLAEKYWKEAKTIAFENQFCDLYPSLSALEIQGCFQFHSDLIESAIKDFHKLVSSLDKNIDSQTIEDLINNERQKLSKLKNDEISYQKLGKNILEFYFEEDHLFGLTLDFEKEYKGTIDKNLNIYMFLKSNKGKISGFYSYQQVGYTLSLEGNIDEQGKIELFEYNSNHTRTGEFTGKLFKNEISGKWRKPFQEPLEFQVYQVFKMEFDKPNNDQSYYFDWFFEMLIKNKSSQFSTINKVHLLEKQINTVNIKDSELFRTSFEIIKRLEIFDMAINEGNSIIADNQKKLILEKLDLFKENMVLKQAFELYLLEKLPSVSDKKVNEISIDHFQLYKKNQIKKHFIRYQMNLVIFFLGSDLDEAESLINVLLEENDFSNHENDLKLAKFAIHIIKNENHLEQEKNKLRKLLNSKGNPIQKELFNYLCQEEMDSPKTENPLQLKIIQMISKNKTPNF